MRDHGSLADAIPADWQAELDDVVTSPAFARLATFVAAERARTDTTIYPPARDVFAALSLTPFAEVRAVILGQDPYHARDGQAQGLAFSVPAGLPWPPSLNNILSEWHADLELPMPSGGSLEPWAKNGVLLLNTVLTVRHGLPNSHKGQGWEEFTTAIIRRVNARPEPVAFLLWGRQARSRAPEIASRHVVIESTHPSPFSANAKGDPDRFCGSRPFTRANSMLKERKAVPVDWTLSSS